MFTKFHGSHLKIGVLRTEVLWMKKKTLDRSIKRGITDRKRAKIENPYLNSHLHINMNLRI